MKFRPRRAAIAQPPAPTATQPTGGEPQSPAPSRQPSDFAGLTKNDIRPGLLAPREGDFAEAIATTRRNYRQYVTDPNGEAIIAGLEAKRAAALAADGEKLPPLSSEERHRALRVAAAARGNGIR